EVGAEVAAHHSLDRSAQTHRVAIADGDLEIAARHRHGDLPVGEALTVARRRDRARGCSRCERVAGAALPDLDRDMRAREDLGELDVRLRWECAMLLDLRTEPFDVGRGDVV